MEGKVKWFNSGKGFGFIHAEQQDYFVHFKNIVSDGFKTLEEGANVTFVPSKGPKGIEAHEVKVIKAS